MNKDPLDHKGLIREAYNIEGIAKPECRSIFLDWALSLPEGQDSREAIKALLGQYSGSNPDHPMTEVLTEGLEAAKAPRRRGGWRSRERS
ncbi:hypothetical protein FDP25_15715 [Roseovarius sp. A21]|uniref:Uncharacterized protein n=1 Tax=Roseovarius bejariae TaxID=2576383 RepID=A0A844CXQ9_9RHOB|nr:hypothetical protein [Roseovarius bejariae]MRU16889.1 hypothetical protein [Roseovarius bejariae]